MTGAHRLEETKRIGRVVQIIQMIASNPGRYLRRSLAEHFEVSERMIQKDLDLIRHSCKFELLHSPAGYSFECVPRFPLNFSLSEALSLLMAVDAAWQISGVGSSELAAAVDKLKSIFPAEFLSLLNKVTDQPLPADGGEHRRRILSLLNHALARKQKVRMFYETRSRDGHTSERTICPYHLKIHVRSWHVIAFCQARQAVRTFKIDRIRQASLTGEHYAIPSDFDVLDYLGETWGVMTGTGQPPVEVVLHFEPEAGHWVAEEQWHATQSFEELPDGSILFRVKIVITPDFVNWLLYYGSRVRVLEPDYLSRQVAAEHLRAAGNSGILEV